MNNTTETQATGGPRHVPVERLQHYNPEVEQRVQGWFASGQPLVWIPILSQENFPDVPQQLLEFADHYQEAMRWPIHRMEDLLQLPNGVTGWLMPATASDTDVACGVWRDLHPGHQGPAHRQTPDAAGRACRCCDRSSRRPRTEPGLTWLLVATARSWRSANPSRRKQ